MAADSHNNSRSLEPRPNSEASAVAQQRQTFKHCAACETTLKLLVTCGINVYRCPTCKGTWIHMKDFKQLAEQEGAALAKFLE